MMMVGGGGVVEELLHIHMHPNTHYWWSFQINCIFLVQLVIEFNQKGHTDVDIDWVERTDSLSNWRQECYYGLLVVVSFDGNLDEIDIHAIETSVKWLVLPFSSPSSPLIARRMLEYRRLPAERNEQGKRRRTRGMCRRQQYIDRVEMANDRERTRKRSKRK